MICYKLFLFFAVPATNVLIGYALDTEYIVGGLPAEQANFKYHVTIMGKSNYSNFVETICGATLIKEDYALSNANCFINYTGLLYQYAFFIAAGSIYLDTAATTNVWIDEIYIQRYNNPAGLIDISVSKLNKSLILLPGSRFSKLYLPTMQKIFFGNKAVLSGFPCTESSEAVKLKYIVLELLSESACMLMFPTMFNSMRMRGIYLAKPVRDSFDICETDAGSPITIGATVVGILSRRVPLDNNEHRLVMYFDVYTFRNFIKQAMLEFSKKQRTPRIFTFKNPIHVMR